MAALRGEVGSKLVFWGADLAPHFEAAKLRDPVAFGTFIPDEVAQAWLAGLFLSTGALDAPQRLEDFTVNNAAKFFGLGTPTNQIEIYEHNWVAPTRYEIGGGAVVGTLGGTPLKWGVRRI